LVLFGSYINKCMNPITSLSRRDQAAEKKTNKWLADNGVGLSALTDATIWQLQAQKAASNLLKEKIHFLTELEQNFLMNYALAMMHKKSRKKITSSQTYQVLNLCKKINRRKYQSKDI
jgi:hypothetical protein